MMFGANISLFAILLANSFAKAVSQNDRLYNTGMTKYRKGPQRTHKGPQRSITQDHRGSTIMRELPNLQQFCLIKKNYFVYFFVILYFLCFLGILEF